MRVECKMDGTVAEKFEKETRDEKPGLDELRKTISVASALSGDNLILWDASGQSPGFGSSSGKGLPCGVNG